MDTVFDCWFIREYPDREDTELHIGIYATEADVLAAIEPLKDKSGFCDYPEGFEIFPVKLGVTGWADGFVTEYVPAMERDAVDRPVSEQD